MPSIRQKASKFFRMKSSSSLSDNGSVKTDIEAGTSGKPDNKRSKTLPVDILFGPNTQDVSLYPSGETVDQPQDILTVVSMPIPELPRVNNESALNGLGGWLDKADGVIQKDADRSAKNAKLNEAVGVFKSFDETLQLKSTAQDIISHVKSTLRDDPWFMRALDDVAKIHPFVSVAVIAFKACYNMEMARRHNDKRVVTLFKEMRDMIEVLIRLKDITDPQVIGPNGSIFQGRLQVLVDGAAQDIKDCGNACDMWMKKKILLRVLVGPAWEGKLAGFTSSFAARRVEFEFALQIHTTTAVDAIQSITQNMNERLAIMSQQFALAFSQMRPPEELRLAEIISSKGGVEAVRSNEAILRELWKAENPEPHGKVPATTDGTGRVVQGNNGMKEQRVGGKSTQRNDQKFEQFKAEVCQDWDTALQSNLQAFEGKFKLYHDQMEANLHRYMHEESDRVISEVTKGPHSLIRDPELRLIWQEMHWRRNVKARIFVITLRDHFAEKLQASATAEKPGSSTIEELSADSWARDYVDVKYLQPIMDAIDDDGSGYVTIAEVNRFTEELPRSLGWSLAVWLAYWAIGWQVFAVKYREEILQTFARMHAMRDRVLPENRNEIERYLSYTWPFASELAKSLRPTLVELSEDAQVKFKEYVQFEEDRLRKNLTAIKYDIDALETVYGVIGPGRIEKHILTLLALMLRRDLELFEMATRCRLHDEEVWDAMDSMMWVLDAVRMRYQDLAVQFEQQNLDIGVGMKRIACELFDYFHDSSALSKMTAVLKTTEEEPTEEPLPSAQLVDIQPNNYPIQTDCPYDCEGYNTEPDKLTQRDLDAPALVQSFLGEWNGFIHNQEGICDKSMVSFFGHAVVDKDHQIGSSSWAGDTPFTLTASVTEEGNTRKIKAVIHYDEDLSDRYFAGVLQEDGTIIGTKGDSGDESTHDCLFFWTRIPAELMRFRPLPPYLVPNEDSDKPAVPNKARAMFDYAIRAVIFQQRKSSWSWSYFKERRDVRLRFLEFSTTCEINDSVWDSNPKELDAILRSVTNPDRRFYDSYWKYTWKFVTHHTAYCDGCSMNCQGSRYICLDCIDNATEEASWGNTVDFCSLSCSQMQVHPEPTAVKTPHMPDHNLLQTRTFVHARDLPQVYGNANRVVELWLHTFLESQNTDQGEEENDTTQPTGPDFSKASIPITSQNLQCGICDQAASSPYWSCVHCLGQDGTKPLIICDSCNAQTLLKCLTCSRPFKQSRPGPYYGLDSRDTYQCVTCIAQRIPAVPIDDAPHTYQHHLVCCYPKEEQAEELTTESRVAAVDQKVDALEERLLKLEGHLERIEKLLANLPARGGITV